MARFWKTPQKTAKPFDITFRGVILTAIPYCPAITQSKPLQKALTDAPRRGASIGDLQKCYTAVVVEMHEF